MKTERIHDARFRRSVSLAAALLVASALHSLGCSTQEGEITSAIDGEVPANGHFVVFANPPMDDVVFSVGDSALEHTVVGGSNVGELAMLVELGDTAPGDVLLLNVECTGCNDSDNGEIRIVDDDTESPTIDDNGDDDVELSAHPLRNSASDFFPSGWEVEVRTHAVADNDTVLFRFHGDGFESLRQPNGNGATFQVSGAPFGNLCFDITIEDLAGNVTSVKDDACIGLVDPGPSCAPPPPVG